MDINTAVSQDIKLCHLGDRLRQLVTVGPRPVHVGFLVDKVTLKRVSVHYFRFSRQYQSTNTPHSLFICYWDHVILANDVTKWHA